MAAAVEGDGLLVCDLGGDVVGLEGLDLGF